MCNLMQELLLLKVKGQQVPCSKCGPNSYICSLGNTAHLDFCRYGPLGFCCAGMYLQRKYIILHNHAHIMYLLLSHTHTQGTSDKAY